VCGIKDGYNSLHAKGLIGGKAYVMTNDTGASVMVVRRDIAIGLPERDPPMKCAVPESGETLTILKEALMTLILGQHQQTTWVFVTNIINDFSRGLNIMHVHDASVDLRHHILRLGDEVSAITVP
jgi:hypothetical protein